jgi:RND family efflux transporter MFP subunit
MKFTAVTILLLSLLLTVSPVFGAAPEEKPEKCPGKVGVVVEKVTPTIFMEYGELEKRVLPSRDNEMKNAVAGVIKKVEKSIGSEVKTDDVILTIDTAKIDKEIADANAELKKWKRVLFQREHWKVRSEGAEKQAKANVSAAEEALKEAEERRAQCSIKAPADGIIGTLNANEGDHVSEGYVVGNIVDVKQVKVSLTTHAEKVSDGQKIEIAIKELSQTVEGTVRKNEEGTFIIMDNSEGKILVGMTAVFKVLFKEHKDVVVLTSGKCLKDESGVYVYTVNPETGRARKSSLKLGAADGENHLVLEGLEAGDDLIVAEVLSAKEGTVKEGLSCLEDNKKIKVMEKNPESGKFVKVKPGEKKKVKKEVVKEEKAEKEKVKTEPVKKEKVQKVKKEKEKKPVEKKVRAEKEQTFMNKFRIGVFVSYYRMFDSVFETVYGRMVGFGIDLSYNVSDNIDIWASGAVSSRKTDVDWTDQPLEFKFTPISLDLRYFFKKSEKWDFFGGAGVNLYPFEDTNPIENVKDNAFGLNAIAGTYYHLTEKLSVKLFLRFNMVKKTIENADNDLNMNSAELLFGLSYNL